MTGKAWLPHSTNHTIVLRRDVHTTKPMTWCSTLSLSGTHAPQTLDLSRPLDCGPSFSSVVFNKTESLRLTVEIKLRPCLPSYVDGNVVVGLRTTTASARSLLALARVLPAEAERLGLRPPRAPSAKHPSLRAVSVTTTSTGTTRCMKNRPHSYTVIIATPSLGRGQKASGTPFIHTCTLGRTGNRPGIDGLLSTCVHGYPYAMSFEVAAICKSGLLSGTLSLSS